MTKPNSSDLVDPERKARVIGILNSYILNEAPKIASEDTDALKDRLDRIRLEYSLVRKELMKRNVVIAREELDGLKQELRHKKTAKENKKATTARRTGAAASLDVKYFVENGLTENDGKKAAKACSAMTKLGMPVQEARAKILASFKAANK